MDISSLKAASDYDDDGIYVLSEDELDGQTVLDLQLELSIIKKRLRSTELAYRALEDEYVALKAANPLCIACIAGLEFAAEQYPNTFQGGRRAGQDSLQLLRQHAAAEEPQSLTPRILAIWVPSSKYARDFIDGFSACEDTLVFDSGRLDKVQTLLGTLLPLPQVKKVYTTLAPSTTSQLLLPHIKQALDTAHESSTSSNSGNGQLHHNNNTSPFMRHKRSFTSASSLSTMSRCSGNGDNALSKFILLQPNSTDMKSIEAVKELKNDICRIYAGNEAISKDLAETDFETLFPRFDCPNMWHTQPIIQEIVITQPILQEIADPAPAPPLPTVEKENAWSEIVRKGRSKEVPLASNVNTAVVPSTPTASLPNAKIPPTPTSPTTISTSPSARKEASTSPSRTRRARGGAKKKDEAAATLSEGPFQAVKLDPTVSLCRQKKPPCNQFYLTVKGCSNPKCNYSHSYKLTERQLDEMRQGAAKTACVYRKNGQTCASGDECVFGHKCPQGSRCKQNKCHFPSHMH